MEIQKVAEQYRLSQWMQVIQEKNNSGQNVKEFCQDKGISPNASSTGSGRFGKLHI